MYKHEMSLYLQLKHADRHVAGRVSSRMDSSHEASHLDVGVSLSMLLSHAARHVCARVSPHMQLDECGLTHSRLCGSILLVDDFYKYPCLPQFQTSIPHQKQSKNVGRERERNKVVDLRVWSILKADTPPRSKILSNR